MSDELDHVIVDQQNTIDACRDRIRELEALWEQTREELILVGAERDLYQERTDRAEAERNKAIEDKELYLTSMAEHCEAVTDDYILVRAERDAMKDALQEADARFERIIDRADSMEHADSCLGRVYVIANRGRSQTREALDALEKADDG